MDHARLNRRDFQRLSMAAFGGAVLGSALPASALADDAEADRSLLLDEPHVCRGLNTCKSKGASGENACAGQGTCATAEHHTCAGQNACKGQGGCRGMWGMNACKGKGGCHVPVPEGGWKKVRAIFEEEMKKAGKQFGDAPAAS